MNSKEYTLEIDRLNVSLYAFALRLTKSSESAEKLVQETRLCGHRHLAKFALPTDLARWTFKGWMCFMLNTIHEEGSRRGKQRKLIDIKIDELASSQERMLAVFNKTDRYLQMTDFGELFNGSHKDCYLTFVMYQSGLSCEEIAKKSSLPFEIVQEHIFKAQHKLKQAIEAAAGSDLPDQNDKYSLGVVKDLLSLQAQS
jgi:DNA-directed RNA polymerase specialized sigma24 family protein